MEHSEVQALLAGVRGLPPPPDLDWELLLRLSALHRVGALLHDAWAGASGVVPACVLAVLGDERKRDTLRSIRGMEQRGEILRLFGAGRIPHLVLKGAALTTLWYGDRSLRPCGDIDLLVPPDALDRARAVLQEAGYVADPPSPVPEHHHIPRMRRPRSPYAVELHHRPAYLPITGWPGFAVLAGRATWVEDGPESIPTLGPEDTLLLLCMHFLADTEAGGGWRLRHLCDLQRHLTRGAIDWSRFERYATEMGIAAACRAVLGLLTLVLPAAVPDLPIDLPAGRRLLPHILVPAPPRRLPHLRLGVPVADEPIRPAPGTRYLSSRAIPRRRRTTLLARAVRLPLRPVRALHGGAWEDGGPAEIETAIAALFADDC